MRSARDDRGEVPRSCGIAPVELLMIVALVSTMLAATSALWLPPRAPAKLETADTEMQTYLRLARLEAIRRSRDCRFAVDVPAGRIRVFDTLGTGDRHDDELLYETAPPAPIPPGRNGGTRYELLYGPDGTARSEGGPAAPHAVDATFDSASQRWTGARWIARR